jgi:hypothetical protein
MSEYNFGKVSIRIPDAKAMYRDMAKPLGTCCKCTECGRVKHVDPAECLRSGWPKCCGYTMTLLPQ